MTQQVSLPDGVFQRGGQYFRLVERVSGDGKTWDQERPVALTLEEAKRDRKDYFDPQYGWILQGYKLAKDRDAADIMGDGSLGGQMPPEEARAEDEKEGE